MGLGPIGKDLLRIQTVFLLKELGVHHPEEDASHESLGKQLIEKVEISMIKAKEQEAICCFGEPMMEEIEQKLEAQRREAARQAHERQLRKAAGQAEVEKELQELHLVDISLLQ